MNDPQKSIFPGAEVDLEELLGQIPECGCYTCMSEVIMPGTSWPATASVFITCPDCGNKRCPKGTHHDNPCTGSNETGQAGSRYA
jgi:hypothetical protein